MTADITTPIPASTATIQAQAVEITRDQSGAMTRIQFPCAKVLASGDRLPAAPITTDLDHVGTRTWTFTDPVTGLAVNISGYGLAIAIREAFIDCYTHPEARI